MTEASREHTGQAFARLHSAVKTVADKARTDPSVKDEHDLAIVNSLEAVALDLLYIAHVFMFDFNRIADAQERLTIKRP